MRRPLKPFVTEYKSSNRRPTGASAEPSPPEGERPSQRLFDTGMRNEPEDTYDAAMRAADALFKHAAPNVPPIVPPTPDRGTDRSGPEPSGRILRVIDEAPIPTFALLEPESPPKRRGRKPGSKNKAKAAPIESRTAAAAAMNAQSAHAIKSVARAITDHGIVNRLVGTDTDRLAAFPPEAGIVRQPKPNASKRFGWQGDKPKPGEDWKRRRLPRACW